MICRSYVASFHMRYSSATVFLASDRFRLSDLTDRSVSSLSFKFKALHSRKPYGTVGILPTGYRALQRNAFSKGEFLVGDVDF